MLSSLLSGLNKNNMDYIEYTILVEVCKDDQTHRFVAEKSWCTLWAPEDWGNLQGSPGQTSGTTGKGVFLTSKS